MELTPSNELSIYQITNLKRFPNPIQATQKCSTFALITIPPEYYERLPHLHKNALLPAPVVYPSAQWH